MKRSRNGIGVQNRGWISILATAVAAMVATAAALGAVFFKDRERSQFVYSLALLTAVATGTLLNISPIKTLSRLAIGDHSTKGWNVAVFLIPMCVLYWLLLKTSRRLVT